MSAPVAVIARVLSVSRQSFYVTLKVAKTEFGERVPLRQVAQGDLLPAPQGLGGEQEAGGPTTPDLGIPPEPRGSTT